MLSTDTKGVFAIAPTPFLPDGSLDEASVDQMTEFYWKAGADGLTILGIMGEAQKLEPEESMQIVRQVIAKADGRPIVVGVSAPGFAAMKRLANEAMEAGAAAVMIAPPSALRTDDQIVGYYAQAIAQIGRDIPFVLQDHPQATGVQITPMVIRRIVDDNPSCVMLKHEDWPGLDKVSQLRDWEDSGDLRHISILCGNGALFLELEMQRGADGAMTGYAFPEMLRDVVDRSLAGDLDGAQDIFDTHLPLLRYEQQPVIGLSVRKYILKKRGAIAHDTLRTPGPKLTDRTRADVDRLLMRLAKFDPRAAI
ncbi:dihydrodipicolinate synthase family protein [Fulvimarina endophytica]|uniref:Dihydrodipicolinate synthase family protein n=1 Tax=Fulvimarina endophytica TaxID=2293836 RepID=A0A371X153_9HYPH|nr:dihydrodipicolinate synthase family protein [Fulvimarina endophytica]RFC62764.1 dihydrodipicolinate synthase family protein [Fulvimarina endophytica]